ncbi:MAG TPA: hypothetical protein VMB50_12810 [Myxococcales bacterium]|nr:hypothetical protein [Myxococcales bacterium]
MTTTLTQTTAYTEARAREVTRKAWADLECFVSRGFLARERLEGFVDDLREFLNHEGVEWFELQIERPNGNRESIRYLVDDSGSIVGNDRSGGLDPWAYPAGCAVAFVIRFRDVAFKNAALAALRNRLGWTAAARSVEGEIRYDRVYSKDGYALRRASVGKAS